jgi:hypothetical protein
MALIERDWRGGYGSLHERLRHFVRFFYGSEYCNLQSEIYNMNLKSLNAQRPSLYAFRSTLFITG